MENAPLYPAFGSGQTLTLLRDHAAQGYFMAGSLAADTLLGVRDAGMLSCSEYAAHLRRMRLLTDKPIIADLQSGFGNPMNTYFATQELERSGANRLILSDQRYPAHTQDCPPIATDVDFLGKLHAALDAVDDENTQIWALLEGMPTQGLETTMAKLAWVDQLPIGGIVIAHWDREILMALTAMPHQHRLIATWQPNVPAFPGIDGWLDTGYLADTAGNWQRQLITNLPAELALPKEVLK